MRATPEDRPPAHVGPPEQEAPGPWLYALEARCSARAAAWRAAEAERRARPGVLFEVEKQRLLADIDGLVEVLTTLQQVAKVPGSAAWVVGVANHRGALLPLIDLSALLFGRARRVQRGPVLVPGGADAPFGLCVDQVIGLRRYRPRSDDEALPAGVADGPAALADAWRLLLTGHGEDAGQLLPVLALAAVARLPAFAATRGTGAVVRTAVTVTCAAPVRGGAR